MALGVCDTAFLDANAERLFDGFGPWRDGGTPNRPYFIGRGMTDTSGCLHIALSCVSPPARSRAAAKAMGRESRRKDVTMS